MAPNVRIYLAVAAGGALGSLLRAGLSLALLGQAWPVLLGGTLAANVLGAFGIVVWAALTAPDGRWPYAPVARHFWMTGVFGGLTTFSIFSLEALVLMSTGAWGTVVAYVGVSVLAWLGAVWLGHRVGCALNG
jgi:fluoride exporter